jgi:glycosyltransferase involved in cell wall biosynthesis
VLAEIIAGLAELGHRIALATFDRPGARDFYSVVDGIDRIRLGIADPTARSGFVDVVRKVRALRSLLTARRPDAAIGLMHSSYVPLALASIGSGVRIVASEHSTYDHFRTRTAEGLLIRATAPLYSAFTVTSEGVRRGFPKAIARRMTPIPNPVPKLTAGKPRNRSSGRKLLLSVGGLREEKDHTTLIAAFARIAPVFPEWVLRIVGDGPMRSALERQIAASGLHSRVELAGAVTEIGAEYGAADLFVMPSSYESFGLATAEALAAGLPAVGFADCPGTNELIHDGLNGVLVAGEDRAGALAAGLSRLMDSDELREAMGAAAPQTVAAFSLDTVVRQWDQLLGKVAAPSAALGAK